MHPETLNSSFMANRKKAKEEVKSPINSTEVISNKGENKEENVLGGPQTPSYNPNPIVDMTEENVPTMEDYENSELNKKAVETLIEDNPELQPEKKAEEEQPQEEQPKKLRIIADDRLNSLINTANEMGITDVVQIINSDRLSQFYLIYRE